MERLELVVHNFDASWPLRYECFRGLQTNDLKSWLWSNRFICTHSFVWISLVLKISTFRKLFGVSDRNLYGVRNIGKLHQLTCMLHGISFSKRSQPSVQSQTHCDQKIESMPPQLCDWWFIDKFLRFQRIPFSKGLTLSQFRFDDTLKHVSFFY